MIPILLAAEAEAAQNETVMAERFLELFLTFSKHFQATVGLFSLVIRLIFS